MYHSRNYPNLRNKSKKWIATFWKMLAKIISFSNDFLSCLSCNKGFLFSTVVIRGIYSSNITDILGNKPFKAFLERQMSKDKPTPLLQIKDMLFWCDRLPFFLHTVIFFVQCFFSTSVTTI